MKRTIILAACACTVMLYACSHFVGEKMLHIKKGATSGEVMSFDGDLVDKDIVTLKGEGLDPKSVYTLIISEMPAANNDNYWIYGFKDNKLFYWGYPYQFQRSDDKEIRVFGELATKVMVDKEYLKATKQ